MFYYLNVLFEFLNFFGVFIMTFHLLTKYVKTKQKTKKPFSGKKSTHCSYLTLFLILNGICPRRALFVKDIVSWSKHMMNIKFSNQYNELYRFLPFYLSFFVQSIYPACNLIHLPQRWFFYIIFFPLVSSNNYIKCPFSFQVKLIF